MCETTGQCHLTRLGPAGQLLNNELAAVGVLLELDHVLVDLQAADFGDLLITTPSNSSPKEWPTEESTPGRAIPVYLL